MHPPLPVIRGIVDAGLIKQILVVNQHNIREAIRNTILHAVSAERFQGHIVVDRGVDAVFGQDVIQRHQCALLCVGDEILVIQFKNIGSLAAGNLRRHLRKVVVIAIGLQVNGDIGVFFHIVVNHLLQILLVVSGPEYCANVIVTGSLEASDAAVLSVEAASEELATVLVDEAAEPQALSASIAAIEHAM